jgi:saccharopine dehydrogenase-like NADP-dependent oxidoreductase
VTFRILILGGYGQFGSRIAATLAGDRDLHVIVAGRDPVKAEAAVAAFRRQGARAALTAAAFDIDRDLQRQLQALQPQLVVHTAGPFQRRDYAVARAALACGAHYVDLADGRAFVAGFDALDEAACRAGRWAISGASSVPGLSAAVVEAHLHRFARLERVESGISPGNRTPRGLATTRAILGYVGKSFSILREGRQRRVHGWQSLRRVRFAGVGPRWFARCEVPDLSVLPARYPTLRDCDFRAGLELRRMHFGLWAASWLVRIGPLRSMEPFAETLLATSERWLGAGSDVGLMYVDLHGTGIDGRPLALRWTLTAAGGDGPQVPATAAIVLARKLARGALPGSGARACLDLFSLAEYLEALRPFAITTSLRETRPSR